MALLARNRFFNHTFPLAYALREVLDAGYSRRDLMRDLSAAFVVALIALPLSMALAIAVGLPPQHGLYTAIVAGAVVPLLGGSRFQVSGPTAAFVVILAPIVSQHGLHGLIWCQLMAGCILIVLGTARLGRLINYVPYPVTTGFTTGIALVLLFIALPNFLGVSASRGATESFLHYAIKLYAALPTIKTHEAAIGLVTLSVTIISQRFVKFLPSGIIGVACGTGLMFILQNHGYDFATIRSQFSYVDLAGHKMSGIPPYPPMFHLPTMASGGLFSLPTYAELQQLFPSAVIIAALAALESLLSATIADSLAGTRHHPNAELNGIGVGNILSGLVAGIPATGAIARTAAMVHNRAATPFACVFHALFLCAFVVLLAPTISYIPMAALAALLLNTAYHMSHIHQFARTLRIAPSADRLVLLTCFGLTVMVDMVAGVSVGIVLASLLFMKRVADVTDIKLETAKDTRSHEFMHLPDGIMVFRVAGPLFFGAVEKAYDRTMIIDDSITTLIIDMERVPFIDMTGLVALESLLGKLAVHGRTVILCGPEAVLNKMLERVPSKNRKHILTFEKVIEAVARVTYNHSR